MLIKTSPDIIVKVLLSILIILFVFAISYLWIQTGHYHFDKNKTHLHQSYPHQN